LSALGVEGKTVDLFNPHEQTGAFLELRGARAAGARSEDFRIHRMLISRDSIRVDISRAWLSAGSLV
jgi:hypothetical protein